MGNQIRTDLEELPGRMRDLPVDDRGYPVPYFVAWLDGKPEFRAMDPMKWICAVREHLCWVCGEKLGVYQTFVLGPMCGMTRTTSEPPCHLECARWSARNCPFLARPRMVRREGGMEEADVAGIALKRNPGVAMLWTTRSFEIFEDDAGKPLIRIHDPGSIEWWAEGGPATREEVARSVETGIPLLLEATGPEGPEEMAHLAARKAWLETTYPAATSSGLGAGA